MRIASYNMKFGGQGAAHWERVRKEIQPDLLLIQECTPGDALALDVWEPVRKESKHLKWGSGIMSSKHFGVGTPIRVQEFEGWVVGMEWPDVEGRVLRAFSVHAPSGLGSYAAEVNRILDCLEPYAEGADLIIGGDFNLTVSERHPTESRTTKPIDRAIQTRLLEAFGLVNCWQTANPDQALAQTLRWTRDPSIAFHCDGLFVSKIWAERLRSCSVLSSAEWDGFSDHNPLVGEFEPREEEFERS